MTSVEAAHAAGVEATRLVAWEHEPQIERPTIAQLSGNGFTFFTQRYSFGPINFRTSNGQRSIVGHVNGAREWLAAARPAAAAVMASPPAARLADRRRSSP
jgi:hypothetical protein